MAAVDQDRQTHRLRPPRSKNDAQGSFNRSSGVNDVIDQDDGPIPQLDWSQLGIDGKQAPKVFARAVGFELGDFKFAPLCSLQIGCDSLRDDRSVGFNADNQQAIRIAAVPGNLFADLAAAQILLQLDS